MSQSRFSIVLVGVSALLRRPLVSRLRPADGERSALPSVSAFAARRVGLRAHGFRFSARTASELPSAGWPSGSRLPLFGTHRFGNCPRRVGSSAGRVGLRAHDFRFSTRTDSEWPLGGLAFGFTASAFRHAPLRSGHWASSFFRLPFRRLPSAGWPSGSLLPLFGTHRFGVALVGLVLLPSASEIAARRVGLRAHGFRFSARTASGLPSASWFYRLPLRRLPLGRLAFGLTASAFRRAPFRGCRSASWFFCLPLRRLPLGRLVLPLGGLAFGLTTSAFRHAPLRSCRSASWRFRSASWFFCLPFRRLPLGGLGFGLTLRGCPRRVGLRAHGFRFSARTASELPSAGWRFRLPFRRCRSASWPSGSLLPLFGTHRSAPPHRRSEDRRSTTTRQLFHFKTLIPTC